MRDGLSFNPHDETINRLKTELDAARRAIIEFAPWEAHQILMSFYSCQSREEAYKWISETYDKIAVLAKVPQTETDSYGWPRAMCPLCARGSESSYETGFTVPEGLMRHLSGWGDHVRQCKVMESALKLAHEYWDEKFRASDAAAEAAKREHTAQRKKTEILYRIAPTGHPQLIAEGLCSRTARNEAQLAWAEQRLGELGFQAMLDGNVKSYLARQDQFVIYADPRGVGEIHFTVYRQTPPKQPDARPGKAKYFGSFQLMDSWKHDLKEKYAVRLVRATNAQPLCISQQ